MMLALNIYRPLSNNGGIVLYHDTEISNLTSHYAVKYFTDFINIKTFHSVECIFINPQTENLGPLCTEATVTTTPWLGTV